MTRPLPAQQQRVLGLTILAAGALAVFALGFTVLSGPDRRVLDLSINDSVDIETVRTGSGPAAEEGSFVTVTYSLHLPDGSEVLSIRDHSHSFTVGDRTVIPGLDAGVRGMKPGGERILTLPPISHYGRDGYAGVIPPDTTLTMKLKLITTRAHPPHPRLSTRAPRTPSLD